MRDFIDRFIHDRPFADLVMLCAGAFGNLAFAALNAILWLVDPSPWHGALTVYFIALVVMSSLVAAATGSNGRLSWKTVAAVCGVTLVVLSALVASIMYLCIVEGHNAALPEIAMIGVAAFTFYNAATAAITATRTRRGNLRQQTMLRVSVAGTIGVMLMLEMQMFGTYARLATPQLVAVMETVTGGVGALLVLLMGCSLLSKLRRVDKNDETLQP